MPQLDGLRALAALCVLWFHWIPVGRHVFGTSLGEIGVWLFFVLSGFLISGILIDACRQNGETCDRGSVLRRFYTRRVLRIFPLFYMALAVALLLDVGSFRAKWIWHVSYLSNVYFAGATDGAGSHLWSLAVEEQFYLLWPILVLFAPRGLLLSLILLLINLAPLFRSLVWNGAILADTPNAGFLTPCALDCLGVGALLAYATRYPSFVGPARLARWLLVTGVVGYGVLHMTGYMLAWKQTCLACFFGWLVWMGSRGFPGWVGKFLEMRFMRYIGKISYGIYVIHGFALFMWHWLLYSAPIPGYRVFYRMNVPPEVYEHQVATVVAMAVITFFLAPISWHFFEKPLNDLKRHFEYRDRRA